MTGRFLFICFFIFFCGNFQCTIFIFLIFSLRMYYVVCIYERIVKNLTLFSVSYFTYRGLFTFAKNSSIIYQEQESQVKEIIFQIFINKKYIGKSYSNFQKSIFSQKFQNWYKKSMIFSLIYTNGPLRFF